MSSARILISFLPLLILFSAPFLVSAALCHKEDKAALLEIKAIFGNPAGLSSWNSKTSCCTWDGISCNATTGRVIDITVFFLNVSAPIPSALARITTLQSINFAYNHLYGTIPPFLGALPDLTFLRLDGNLLTGRIPDTLTVYNLLLTGNNLSGPLPPSFAHASFGALDLNDNGFSGDASFLFGKDKTLYALDISGNKFAFDFGKVDLPKDMNILQIDHNMIYGSIPAAAATRRWLRWNVSYNRLCGPIPQGSYVRKYGPSHFNHNKCLCGAPLAPCA
ncbi:polygalacturonase inhibitor 1-like [Typha angustifolia]|uniref:polygalacturonase inhibitor 1-like n=1 Tax=Typha angustifolia TaxID=59011 RepID=UPI003C2DD949